MFCKNCGAQLNENAAFCVNCGVAAGQGNAYCSNCGNAVAPNAAVCLKCGAALGMQGNVPGGVVNGQQKSKIAAGLLGIFLGAFGVHNFYLGYTGKAVAQLLITLLSCFFFSAVSSIWGLIEGIMILCGSIIVDGTGIPLKE